jgi:predicted ABC-type ATPase
MAERKDLATESTFSHPSKLDLVREAKQSGYDVRIYHVNVRSPEVAVKRVERRVSEGGHPVPENKTRERYERNQPIIRDAVLIADRAYVFDNSTFGKPHERVLEFKEGRATFVSEKTPAWARNCTRPSYALTRQSV